MPRDDYRYGPDDNRVGAFERRKTAIGDIATSWSYAYDALGRLISERRTIDNVPFAFNLAIDPQFFPLYLLKFPNIGGISGGNIGDVRPYWYRGRP